MTTAPTLTTDRLTLAMHHPGDLDALAAMWAEPAVYAMIGGVARSREEVWIRLLRSIGQWQSFGYGSWVIRDRAGTILGECGLMEARRAIDPPLDVPEANWVLAPDAQGRGVAGEAMTAALAWATAQGIARTTCIIAPENAASLRLAERLGYARAREATYHGRTVVVLER